MIRPLVLTALLGLVPIVAATTPEAPRDRALWNMEGFLYAHPDVKYRKLGFWHLEQNEPDRAFQAFRKAARYSDKASQAMLAEMYWLGDQLPKDRAQAYAWMDLAAERGYSMFVGRREAFWQQLDDAEGARALAVGAPIYAEFGDDAAKPRLEGWLMRQSRNANSPTGSRVGAVGPLQIIPVVGRPAGMGFSIAGDTYYNRKYWAPKRYFEWTDSIWIDMPQTEVEVGELQSSDR